MINLWNRGTAYTWELDRKELFLTKMCCELLSVWGFIDSVYFIKPINFFLQWNIFSFWNKIVYIWKSRWIDSAYLNIKAWNIQCVKYTCVFFISYFTLAHSLSPVLWEMSIIPLLYVHLYTSHVLCFSICTKKLRLKWITMNYKLLYI